MVGAFSRRSYHRSHAGFARRTYTGSSVAGIEKILSTHQEPDFTAGINLSLKLEKEIWGRSCFPLA